MKRNCYLFLVFLFAILGKGTCQDHWKPVSGQEVPPKPNQLVDDLADILSPGEEQSLEQKLVAESDSTSTQIAVLTIDDLNGYDISSLAFKIGDAWGIGGPNQDNGVLILVSKNDHAVFIATGRGMEGPLPDVTAKKIIDNIIVPEFRNGNYYDGLDKATTAIIKLASGEFSDELQDKKDSLPPGAVVILIAIIIFIVWLFSRINRGGGGGYISRGGWFPWMMMGGLGRGGGFGGGGFGGGGGGFGGGGGGFGGFGGGSFGGGGAGGRW
jgi:uncharacterized protein